MHSALCVIFSHTNEVYAGIYPSSIICVIFSRKIVLKCKLTVFAHQHDTYRDATSQPITSLGTGFTQSLATLGPLDGVARHHAALYD